MFIFVYFIFAIDFGFLSYSTVPLHLLMNLKIIGQLLKTFGEKEQVEVFFNQYVFKRIKFDTIRHLF